VSAGDQPHRFTAQNPDIVCQGVFMNIFRYHHWFSCCLPALLLPACVIVASGQETEKKAPESQQVQQFVERALQLNDKNSDGEVTKDEAGQLLRKNFAKVDTDGDGIVAKAEFTVLAKRLTARWRAQRNTARKQTAVPEGVVFNADIAYREGNSKWKLDLAQPEAKAERPRPAIVFIHGGGWASGDKGSGLWRTLPLEYASRGYVCVSINYRLTNEGTILDCIADCKCAVRWLRANAEKYSIDKDRIGAYGNSAGAHLVSVLGLASKNAGLEGDGPFQDASSLVQAVCCSAPPTDFTHWLNPAKNPKSPASRLFGRNKAEQAARRSSPVTHATKQAPPFLIIHGTADRTVPVSQGDALERALKKAGANDVTYMKIEGAGHGVFGQHSARTRPAMQAFFDRILKDQSEDK